MIIFISNIIYSYRISRTASLDIVDQSFTKKCCPSIGKYVNNKNDFDYKKFKII